jgi:Tfp pilus assembly protein PilX
MTGNDALIRRRSGERGMALISALLLLLVVSLLAVGLSMDSSMDVRLAAYQKFRARAFGFAESGLMAGADILESNTADAGWDDAPPFEFPHLSNQYVGTLDILANGLADGTFYLDENPNESVTLEMTGDIESDVIIQKVVSQINEGAAMQVAAGYAGVGKGLGGGGAKVIYNIESSGFDANNARSSVAMNYRMITK